ncbi:cysteine proteinase [Microthyrium microscopicum]|uniref:Ubiquitin carboxyl-terminal hydrolase n=1 Tax=Microthyrium microscopicum TaxID=703497 RepID=A0A6A6U280_9PEZI|nr:cysteine proteinase [Microthyrium microscopicum]
MTTIPVVVKHQGKKYDVELDPSSNGETFKFQLYSLTGVEPERQKILVKGGQLKDDTPLSSLGAKKGHVFMMMGSPSGSGTVIEKPKEKIRFLEDMTEAEAAQSEGAIPPGLQNLGNTCYMNATIQTLKSIPELQSELGKSSQSSSQSDASSAFASLLGSSGMSSDLVGSLRDLFNQMSKTQYPVTPVVFLNSLRATYPQFAQRARDGNGYAQQDAEEAWSQVISQIRQKVKTKEVGTDGKEQEIPFVDQYMSGTFESIMECDEKAAKEGGEEPVKSTDTFLKLNCHINGEVSHLRDGLANGLVEKIEKRSSVLDRDAIYTKTSKITRLPKYLTVHYMRFDWRRTSNKKAKIMKKVVFPQELDVVEFCGETLSKKLTPIRDKFREVRGMQEDHERARKRQKRNREDESKSLPAEAAAPKGKDKDKKEEKKPDVDVDMEGVVFKTDAEVEAERHASVLAAKQELRAMLNPEDAADPTTNHTGLYELRGIITHQGMTADSGHYTAFVKKSPVKDPRTGEEVEDGKWWWFNDDKVSEYESDRIEQLSGGGQSHSALVLLYRAVAMPIVEETKDATTAGASSS